MKSAVTINVINNSRIEAAWYAFARPLGIINCPGVIVTSNVNSLVQMARNENTRYVIKAMKFTSMDALQMNHPIYFSYKGNEGLIVKKEIVPALYKSVFDLHGLIKIQHLNIEITGDMIIEGTINAQSSITIELIILQKKIISGLIGKLLQALKTGWQKFLNPVPELHVA